MNIGITTTPILIDVKYGEIFEAVRENITAKTAQGWVLEHLIRLREWVRKSTITNATRRNKPILLFAGKAKVSDNDAKKQRFEDLAHDILKQKVDECETLISDGKFVEAERLLQKLPRNAEGGIIDLLYWC